MVIPHYHLISETANPKVNICRVTEQREGKILPDRLFFSACFSVFFSQFLAQQGSLGLIMGQNYLHLPPHTFPAVFTSAVCWRRLSINSS